jgi:O-antigen/teichoic acid export membrane protein
VFLAFRRPEFTLLSDGLVQSVVKVATPVALVWLGAYGIFLSCATAFGAASVVSACFMVRALSVKWARPRSYSEIRRLQRFSGSAYVASVLNIIPLQLQPMIVLHALGAAQAGVYFIVFQISSLVNNAIAVGVGQAMYAEGAHNEGELSRLVRKAGLLLTLLLVPAIAILVAVGGLILHYMGAEYTQSGMQVLRVLLLGCFVGALNTMSTFLLKLTRLMNGLILANAVSCAVTLGMASAFAGRGLVWVAAAWISGNAAGAIVGFVAYGTRAERNVGVMQ